MRIGLFTDTYFPQVSGVATSIATLKKELELLGHEVYIFTTTDKNVKRYENPTIIRLPSVPFISFTDRRVIYRGFLSSYKIAKQYKLDIIHTQTEFNVGILGKLIARALHIPVIHTYHTQYEDYVGYIANGMIIRPSMVKYIMRGFLNNLDGVICPSAIVLNLLDSYKIKVPKRIIPTGIPVEKFNTTHISESQITELRERLGIGAENKILLSLSRISYEKNIQAIIRHFPNVLRGFPNVKLVIVGDGPYLSELKDMVDQLELEDSIIFTGMINHDEVPVFYKASDYFISASTSETQGLTYIESLASRTPIIAQSNPYLDDLVDSVKFGYLYEDEKEISETIIQALEFSDYMDQLSYENKLYEISSKKFGLSVFEFYLDTIIAHKNKQREKLSLLVKGSPTERSFNLAKSAVRLPKTAYYVTKKTSKKALKIPKKIVHILQDFLD